MDYRAHLFASIGNNKIHPSRTQCGRHLFRNSRGTHVVKLKQFIELAKEDEKNVCSKCLTWAKENNKINEKEKETKMKNKLVGNQKKIGAAESNKKIVYVAKEKNTNPLIISNDDIQKYLKDPRKLLNKLNKSGFNLGSGHEKIEFEKIGGKEFLFSTIPYYGHPGQRVIFKKKFINEEDMSAAFGYEETIMKNKLVGNQKKIDVAPPKGKITSADFKALQAKKKKGVEEHHNDPNFPGGPAIHDMLDRVAADWGEDSDLYNDLEDAIVGWSDRHGNLTPKGKIAIKALLSNWDVLEDYGWLLEPKPADHTGETTSMEEEGYMGTQYDSSEDMAVDMIKKGIREEDHEVSMAQNSLKSIVSSASQLMNLLGDDEKDIPAWIQDHITNAANFISQAAENYHEYNNEPEAIPTNNMDTEESPMSLQKIMQEIFETNKKKKARV